MNRVVLICQLLFFAFIVMMNVTDVSAQTVSGRNRPIGTITASKTVYIGAPSRPRSASAIEKEVFSSLNHERQKRGLAALVWSDRVAKVARLHSRNMADQRFFGHRGKDGTMVSDRASRAGVRWSGIGENIVYFGGSREPVSFAVKCWMDSQGHKQNILNKRWQESGIGVFTTPDGSYYLTQVFLY